MLIPLLVLTAKEKSNTMIRIAGVLLVRDGMYVLQHRKDLPHIAEPGMYSLWGGTLEQGEMPKQAAVREVLEETGLVLEEDQLIELTDYDSIARAPKVKGKPLHVWVYVLELASSQVVECYEGQGIITLPIGTTDTTNMTDFVIKAIQAYEATSR